MIQEKVLSSGLILDGQEITHGCSYSYGVKETPEGYWN